MTARRIGIVALLALVAVLPARAAQETVLLYPPDLTLAAGEKVKVYAFRPGKGAPDNVSVNGVPGTPLEGDFFLKGEATLFPGLNVLQAGDRQVRLFFLPGTKLTQFLLPSGKEGEEPLPFQPYRLHPALDDGCEGCHTAEGGKLGQKDQKESCYACHNDFSKAEDGKKVYLHDPVAKGECTGCHDPHFSAKPKLQKLEKGCNECHDPFPSKGTVHLPVGKGECTVCHSPHAGPAPKQLVRPGNALCAGCHENPHDRHRTARVRGRMTEVPQDFPTENDQLACLGCHAAHQSAERKLFRAGGEALCKSCHRL